MIDLRIALSTYLRTLHSRVYFQVAPEAATYPYIVYDIPSIFDDGEGGEVATIDINGWDLNDTGDTMAIETLMSTINSLNKQVLTNGNMSVAFFVENKLSILDDDKRIKRRQYTYTGRIFRR